MANLLEIWMNALPLHEAWWLMGPDEQKNQYSDAGGNLGLTKTVEKYLHDDLIYRIYQRELLAIGIKISPPGGSELELIPSYYFSSPIIDWDTAKVTVFGVVYEDVRVLSAGAGADLLAIRGKAVSGSEPTARGRPPEKMTALLDLVDRLASAGQLNGLLRKQQVILLQAKAQEEMPDLFIKSPDRKTALKALNKIRSLAPLKSPKNPRSP
jgi:hypothetical protein